MQAMGHYSRRQFENLNCQLDDAGLIPRAVVVGATSTLVIEEGSHE